jgi:hypothetical protein
MVMDFPLITYFQWADYHRVFMYFYWHHRKELGWGSAGFADGHASFVRVSNNNPDFQRGPDWTFIYSDRR